MKKIFLRLIDFCILLIGIIAPTLLMGFYSDIQGYMSLWDSLTYITLYIALAYTIYRYASYRQLITKPNLTPASLKLVWQSFGLLFILNLMGSIFLNSQGLETTENQSAIYDIIGRVALLPFGFTIIGAGFFEEIFFRAYIFSLFPKGNWQILAVIASSLAFGWAHDPSDWPSWFIYTSMGLIFSLAYFRSKTIYTSMAAHALWNTLGYLGMILMLLLNLK